MGHGLVHVFEVMEEWAQSIFQISTPYGGMGLHNNHYFVRSRNVYSLNGGLGLYLIIILAAVAMLGLYLITILAAAKMLGLYLITAAVAMLTPSMEDYTQLGQ